MHLISSIIFQIILMINIIETLENKPKYNIINKNISSNLRNNGYNSLDFDISYGNFYNVSSDNIRDDDKMKISNFFEINYKNLPPNSYTTSHPNVDNRISTTSTTPKSVWDKLYEMLRSTDEQSKEPMPLNDDPKVFDNNDIVPMYQRTYLNQHFQKFRRPKIAPAMPPLRGKMSKYSHHKVGSTQYSASNRNISKATSKGLIITTQYPYSMTYMPLHSTQISPLQDYPEVSQNMDIRPKPSEYLLPVSDLRENPDPKYDPNPDDLNPARLKEIMGRSWDPRFMSYIPPSISESRILYYGFRQNPRGLPAGNRISMYRLLPMSFKMVSLLSDPLQHLNSPSSSSIPLQQTSRNRKIRLRISRKIRRKLYKYLLAYTACPVLFEWKYIGKRFWPPYILEGSCYGSSHAKPDLLTDMIPNDLKNEKYTNDRPHHQQAPNDYVKNHHLQDSPFHDFENNHYSHTEDVNWKSCSIPPGMMCKPATSINLNLLRWYCQNWESKNFCSWIFVQYPIIESCKCTT